jgi:hypothetical protein
MVLSSNWGICGMGNLSIAFQSHGGSVSGRLSSSNNYSKSTKLAKIHKKACVAHLTAFISSKLTEFLNLKNLAPLYF